MVSVKNLKFLDLSYFAKIPSIEFRYNSHIGVELLHPSK